MRYAGWVALLGLCLLPGASRAAEEPPAPRAAITVDAQNVGFRTLLGQVFAGSGLRYTLAPEVPNVPVSVKLRDVDRSSAIRVIVRLAASQVPGLTFSRRGDEYLFRVDAGARRAAGRERFVTLTAEDAPLRKVVAQIFAGSGLQYVVDPIVPDVPVTVNIREVSLESALRAVVKIAASQAPGLTVEREGDVYVIELRRESPGAGDAGKPVIDVQPGTGSGPDRHVTLTLKDAPLRAVIDQIFAGSGLQYAVEANVPDVPITLNIRDVTLPSALRTVVKIASSQVPGLTQSRDGDVYIIKIRKPLPAGDAPPEDPRLAAPPPLGETEYVEGEIWEKMPLLFLDAVALARSLGVSFLGEAEVRGAGQPARRSGERPSGPPTDSVFVPGGASVGVIPDTIQAVVALRAENALLVRGPADDVQTFKQLLRLIDVPQRQIRVRLSAGALGAEGQALNGTPVGLSDAAGGERLEARVTPRLNGDGSIDLAIEGTLVKGGVSRPVASHLRVEAGKAVQVLTLGQGGREMRLWVRASPVVEPGEKARAEKPAPARDVPAGRYKPAPGRAAPPLTPGALDRGRY